MYMDSCGYSKYQFISSCGHSVSLVDRPGTSSIDPQSNVTIRSGCTKRMKVVHQFYPRNVRGLNQTNWFYSLNSYARDN